MAHVQFATREMMMKMRDAAVDAAVGASPDWS